jgi:hypothetical protein
MFCILASDVINTFIFQGNYGVISQTLTYPIGSNFAEKNPLLNIAVVLLVSIIILELFKKHSF